MNRDEDQETRVVFVYDPRTGKGRYINAPRPLVAPIFRSILVLLYGLESFVLTLAAGIGQFFETLADILEDRKRK